MGRPVFVMVDYLYGPLDGLTDTAEVDLDDPLASDSFARRCDNARRVSETARRGEVACISDVAGIIANANGGEVGRTFEVSVDAWPRCKYPHVIGTLSVDYHPYSHCEYEITDRLEHGDQILIRAKFRRLTDRDTIIMGRYDAIL